MGQQQLPTASIWFTPTWVEYRRASCFATDEERRRITRHNDKVYRQFRGELAARGLDLLDLLDAFHAAYGQSPAMRAWQQRYEQRPTSSWPGWWEARDMITIALGGSEPRWMGGSWWHDRAHYPLAHIATLADVAAIPVPDWPTLPVVRRMLDAEAAWRQAHPAEPLPNLGTTYDLPMPDREPLHSIVYPSFVDLGAFLMGLTDFLALLGSEPDVADALMDRLFAISTGYTDFLLKTRPEPIEALTGFGGDATCMLSPALFDRYGAAWDARLFEHVRHAYGLPAAYPCNYHSCGPSSHLYDAWGRHPHRECITTLQTRLIPGAVGRLRDSFPDALLELTIHPPHFDAARATPDEVHAVLWESAQAAGFRNVSFTIALLAHQWEHLPRMVENIRVLHSTMQEMRPVKPEL